MNVFGVISAGAGAAAVQVIVLKSLLIISQCDLMSPCTYYDLECSLPNHSLYTLLHVE